MRTQGLTIDTPSTATDAAAASLANPQQYTDSHPSNSSAGRSRVSQPTTAGIMSHYPQYQQQPPVLQPGPGTHAPSPTSYDQQFSYQTGVGSLEPTGRRIPFIMDFPSYSSAGRSFDSQATPAEIMSLYPQYQEQPPALQPGHGTCAPSPTSNNQQYGYQNGAASPHPAGHSVPLSMGSQTNSAMLPLPGKL